MGWGSPGDSRDQGWSPPRPLQHTEPRQHPSCQGDAPATPQPSSSPRLPLATGQAKGSPELGGDRSNPVQLQLSPAGDFPGISSPLSLPPDPASPSLPPSKQFDFYSNNF